jgi:choline dehydrogenase-like flavoprotein
VLGVRPAHEHPNGTLLTGTKVTRLETNEAGDVGHRGGRRPGRRGGALHGRRRRGLVRSANSTKLLLQSANDRHPNGLANGSDQVGRNYMFHDSTAVLALSREENETAYQVAGAAVPRARSVRPGGVAERILEVV